MKRTKSRTRRQPAKVIHHASKSARRRAARCLNRQLQTEIRKEAKALGLTAGEYLRLLIALSKSLRKGLLQEQTFDARALLQLAESPLFATLIQYVAQSASTMVTQDADEESPSAEARKPSEAPPPPSQPPSSPSEPWAARSPAPPHTRPAAPMQPPWWDAW
jgi:hypothetical protein